MAAEIVMPEVTQTITEIVMPEVTPYIDYHLNPVFDYAPFWGWPIWIWIFIAFGVVFLILNLRWIRKRIIMKPVLAYLDALKGGKREDMQTWMIGKNKSFFIEHLKYNDDGVISYFKYLKNISMWYLGSSLAIGHAGGIKNAIVSDNYDMVRDPVAEIAFCLAIEEYNEKNKVVQMNDKGEPIIDENGKELVSYPINNYEDFKTHRKDMIKANPLGAKMPSFCYFDVLKAQQFFPPNRTAGMFGADNIREARKKNIDQPVTSGWLKFAPLGIAFGISVIAIIITYMWTRG